MEITHVAHAVMIDVLLVGVAVQGTVVAGIVDAIVVRVYTRRVLIDLRVAIIVQPIAHLGCPRMNLRVGVIAVRGTGREAILIHVAVVHDGVTVVVDAVANLRRAGMNLRVGVVAIGHGAAGCAQHVAGRPVAVAVPVVAAGACFPDTLIVGIRDEHVSRAVDRHRIGPVQTGDLRRSTVAVESADPGTDDGPDLPGRRVDHPDPAVARVCDEQIAR